MGLRTNAKECQTQSAASASASVNMNVQHQQEDFAKKKQEREQEIQAIQEMLNNITKSKSEEKTDANVQKFKEMENKTEMPSKDNNIVIMRRSNTDLQIQRATTTNKPNSQKPVSGGRQSRIDSVRSQSGGSANKTRSKSLQLPATNNKNVNSHVSSTNKKTYDPEEARRFMELQKKKRRSEAALQPDAKANREKEEIKKRLEELKKNTRKLVSKNLDKKKQKNCTNRLDGEKISIENKTIKSDRVSKESVSLKGLSLEQKTKGQQSARPAGEKQVTAQSVSHSLPLASAFKSHLPLAENHKRIGLLRKTEDEKDYSFSALKSIRNDKENRGLEELTSKLNTQFESKLQRDKENGNGNELKQTSLELNMLDNVSDLEIPKKTLETSPKKHDLGAGEISNKEDCRGNPSKSQDLPFLLRPTAAQVYPYNFIMAVRRKLEAISQPTPVVPIKREKMLKNSQATSTNDLLLGEHKEPEKKRKLLDNLIENENKKRKSLEGSDIAEKKTLEGAPKTTLTMSLESLKSPQQTYTMDFHKDTEKIASSLNKSFHSSQEKTFDSELELLGKTKSKYKSVESIVSNYSSSSLPLPISNTLTEVSSLRTESRRTFAMSQGNSKQSQLNTEDEVTSISSQIFSSPEKKYSKQYQNDFEFVKPRPVSPLSLEKVENLKIKSKSKNQETPGVGGSRDEDRELHFSQLLDDFNRSLSQVIQVNEQLKSTLDKSSRILSPRSNVSKNSQKESSDKQQQYSSDFENSLSTTPGKDKLKLSLENTNEKLKTRKRQLFQMANQVKPLLTSPPRESPLPQLDLQLQDNSNNRKTSSYSQDQENEEGEDENTLEVDEFEHHKVEEIATESKEYEKRLGMIEKLKENLKQNIKESQNNRAHKSNADSFTTSVHNKKSNMSVYTSEDGRENLQELKAKSFPKEPEEQHSSRDKHSQIDYEDCRDKEDLILKYTKSLQEENSNEETIILYKRNKIVNPKRSSSSNETKKRAAASESYDSVSSQSNVEEITSSKYSQRSNSNYTKTETYSMNSKSEIMTGRGSNKNEAKRNSSTNEHSINTNSSILEDLQKIQEFSNKENENPPPAPSLSCKNKTKSHSETAANFINCHINRSRGDFQELNTKEATLNETQFHLAIRSSQTSCTELSQSADDEVTTTTTTASSIKSIMKKQSNDISSNPPSYNAVSKNNPKSQSKEHNPSISLLSPSKASRRISIGTEIVNFFHKYDHERSSAALHQGNDTISESSLNYSNVGLYDKLIQNEMNKTQHLTALLKMREKALMDRTKGQIAWLEVQKARYKAKGLLGNIAAIKKKQRGILLKMEKEREEIKRLLQSTSSSNTNVKSSIASTGIGTSARVQQQHSPTKYKKDKTTSPAHFAPKVPLVSPITNRSAAKSLKSPAAAAATVATIKPSPNKTNLPQTTPSILKATYELESSAALEELLKKREEDLRKRRQHVEHLMKWHQRLDEEEAEVLQLERQLLSYNNVQQHFEKTPQSDGHRNQKKSLQQMPPLEASSLVDEEEELTREVNLDDTSHHHIYQNLAKETEKKRASRARKMEKRLKDIDKSLKELSHISATNTTNTTTTTASNSSAFVMGHNNDDIEVSSASQQELDFVRTTGSKLNKLWRRLTSQTVEKFEPTRRYKLCKADLERLYEEAKMAVLRDFAADEERIAQELLEKSSVTTTANTTAIESPTAQSPQGHVLNKSNFVEVPVLNLNFSSGHSEADEDSATKLAKVAAVPAAANQGIYSPSVAEENFKAQLLNSSASSSSAGEQPEDILQKEQAEQALELERQQQQEKQKRIENNVQIFLALTQRLHLGSSVNRHQPATTVHQQPPGLQRSLSDTEIADIPKFSAATTTSHRNVSANTSQNKANTATTTTATIQNVHQKSKSCIAEVTNYIPYETNRHCEKSATATTASSTIKEPTSRPTVIATVGRVPPINPSQTSQTPQKLSFSGQFEYDSEAKAKEISSKLDEISAAVNLLSQANALPSYPAAIQSKNSSAAQEGEQTSITEEANLSTNENSSYSLNFANISIDRHSSPGSQQLQSHTTTQNQRSKTPISPTNNSSESSSSQVNTFVVSPNGGSSSKTFTKDNSTTSNCRTFTKEQTPITTPPGLSKTVTVVSPANLDKTISEDYEPDFEPDITDETHIDDISLPLYETTVSEDATTTIEEGDSEVAETSRGNGSLSNKTYCAETKQDQLPVKTPTITVTSTSPEKELLPPPPSLPPPPPALTATATASSSSVISLATTTSGASGAQINATSNGNALMPDIINELELRRHPLIIDNEHLKQLEHVAALPYMYVREIPNKPPPPYVPPAHGSPMTTIFPSEERIKDITFRRTHELYCELLKTEYCNEKGEKLPSVMEEQITNIYERIILDICREYLEEHSEILREGDPTNFHSQLAFFNPPNRLHCIQNAIYKEVRHCLAMDKTPPKRTQIYSVYGQRAKQDHIGKIIIQEMYDEDDRWCNFHREESEVLILIVEEMINKNIRDIAKEVMLEEGIPLDDADAEEGIEIEEIVEETSEMQENLENTLEEEQRVKETMISSVEVTEKDSSQLERLNNTKSIDDIGAPASPVSATNQQCHGNGVVNDTSNSFKVSTSA